MKIFTLWFNHETWGITLLIMGIYDDLWGFIEIYRGYNG